MKRQGWGKRLLVKFGIVVTAVATCWGGFATATTAAAVDTSCPTTPNAEDGRPEIDVTKCGSHSANPMDSVDDTDAVEFATNQLNAVAGGGHVYFPPAADGAYLVHGVDQRSNVDYYGSDASTTILKRLGTADPNEAVLRGQLWKTTGSIAKGQSILTVADASKIAVGSVIAVRGAGGANPVQTSTLTLPILAGSTSLTIPKGVGIGDWANLSDSRHLIIDNELISYTELSGNTFKGLGRGVNTTASGHGSGAKVSQALQLLAEVTSISANRITLDRTASFTVSAGSPVIVGSSNMSVRNLTVDGNQPMGGYVPSGANPMPMNYTMARYVKVTGCVVRNGDNGGIRLERGTRDSLVQGNTFIDNGEEVAPGSGHVWAIFRVERTVVRNNTMSGPMRRGVVIDDRTEHANSWDGPSIFVDVINNTIDMREDPSIGPNPGPVAIANTGAWSPTGGTHGVIAHNTLIANQSPVTGGGSGVNVGADALQGTNPLFSNKLQVFANTFGGQQIGITTNGIDSTFAGNAFTANDIAACHEEAPASGNAWTNNSADCTP